MHGSGGGGSVVVPDTDTLTFDETGVGDPLLGVDFGVLGPGDTGGTGAKLGLYVAAKLPVADEDSGFGTGEWDYGAGVTVSGKAGVTLLFADLGFWVFGDLPDLELKHPLVYSLGIGRPLPKEKYSILAAVSGYTETIEGADGSTQLALTLDRLDRSKTPSKRWTEFKIDCTNQRARTAGERPVHPGGLRS
jgi:hypothetical protein